VDNLRGDGKPLSGPSGRGARGFPHHGLTTISPPLLPLVLALP